ncbi:MAG: hypothetical protein HFJ27_06055 [Clostridia bacterium]|nr:hypothetical protein [Clostridia bacterium]
MKIEISNKNENYQYISKELYKYNNENGNTPYFKNRSEELKDCPRGNIEYGFIKYIEG